MAAMDEDRTGRMVDTIDPERWVEQHGDTLYRYALSRLRDPEAAEEVVQETFVAGLRARDQYTGRGSEGAWLMGICKRKVIDHMRRRNRVDGAAGGDQQPDPSLALFDANGHWRHDARLRDQLPESAMLREEFWQIFRRCLEQLSAKQADAFTLRELEGMTSEEICRTLEITPSNLWVLLYRARLGLTACMRTHLES